MKRLKFNTADFILSDLSDVESEAAQDVLDPEVGNLGSLCDRCAAGAPQGTDGLGEPRPPLGKLDTDDRWTMPVDVEMITKLANILDDGSDLMVTRDTLAAVAAVFIITSADSLEGGIEASSTAFVDDFLQKVLQLRTVSTMNQLDGVSMRH